MKLLKNNWPYAVLILIIALGAFLNLWDLSNVPPGVYPDEAKNANDAIVTLTQNDYKIFYPENNGREGLYIWLIALSFKFFGISIFSFKLVSAFIGTLSILATYLVTKEIFLFMRRENKAYTKIRFSFFAREISSLLAAGFLATSFWHINFSRIGFRAIFVPLLLSLAIYFTLRAVRTKNFWDIIFAGAILGLGYYTYIAFRIALIIPLFLIFASYLAYLYNNRPQINMGWVKKMLITDGWWKFAFWPIAFALAVLPLIREFIQNPGTSTSRSGGISVFGAEQPILEFAKSLGLHLQMFFAVGDGNWRHNFSGDAQLAGIVALLFIAGLVYSVWVSWEGVKYKNWSIPIVHLTLLGWFFAMLMPAALTVEGLPHALRAIGVMPPVFIFASFGFLFFIKLLFPHRHHRSEIWPFGLGTALILILFLASSQFSHYFIDWAQSEHVEGAFSKNYVEIGNYFNELPSDTHKYLIVNSGGVDVSYSPQILTENNETKTLSMPAQTTFFIQQTKDIDIKNTTYLRENEFPTTLQKKNVFVPLNRSSDLERLLKQRYPTGQEEQFEGFWSYSVDL